MTPLSPAASLPEMQTYIAEMVKERGFDKQTASDRFMKLLEEGGELSKAARMLLKYPDDTERKQACAHEAADILIYLLDICNIFGIDLDQAFREKEAINETRTWA